MELLFDAAEAAASSFDQTLEIARKTLVRLKRRNELEEKLGEVGPALSATIMHRDVLEAAKSLWRSDHFTDAVLAVARSGNAALQKKGGAA